MKKIIIFIFVLNIQFALSQTVPYSATETPNTASLGVYGDIPVGYFTGVPNISIPIYTLESGSIKLPITLSYHPGAVKPNQHPGWVGLGWDLQSYGVITRTQNNYLDEIESNNIFRPYYQDACNDLVRSDWDSFAKTENFGGTATSENGVIKDLIADEFSFNFLGYTGKFYYTANGWAAVCDQNIKIEQSGFIKSEIRNIEWITPLASTHTQPRQFKGFTITTDDGTRYVFGGVDEGGQYAIEFARQYSHENYDGGYAAVAWYLVKIIDANNNEIKFRYERGNPTVSLSFSSSIMSYFDCKQPSLFFALFNPSETFEESATVSTSTHGGFVSYPIYLKGIYGPNDKLEFASGNSTELRYSEKYFKYYDDRNSGDILYAAGWFGVENKDNDWINPEGVPVFQWRKLNSITISSTFSHNKKKYRFIYNNSKNERLRLSSLVEQDQSESSNKIYNFDYYNFDLGPYGGDYTDHWGYYNGNSVNYKTFESLITEKNTVENKVTNGLLKEIRYPTGGYTEFIWEANKYARVVSADRTRLENFNGLAGRCRIKEIKSYSGSSSTPLKKEYFYVLNYLGGPPENYISSGVLNGKPQYYTVVPNRKSADKNLSVEYKMKSVNGSVSYGYNGQGLHIGYSEVVEKNADGSYSKYTYTDFGTDINGEQHFDKPAASVLGWLPGEDRYITTSTIEQERGKPLSIVHYNNNNVPVKSIQYVYDNNPERFNSFIKRCQLNLTISCVGYDALVLGSAFKEFTYRYNVKEEIETNYAPNPLVTKTTYSYNNIGYISELKKSQSNGNVLLTKYKYPSDFSYNNSATLDACFQDYFNCKTDAEARYNQCRIDCNNSPEYCNQLCPALRAGLLSGCESGYNSCLSQIPGLDLWSKDIITMKHNFLLSKVVEEQTFLVYSDQSKKTVSGQIIKYSNQWNNNYLPSKIYEIKTDIPTSTIVEASINSYGNFSIHPDYKIINSFDKYDSHGNLLQNHNLNDQNMAYIWGYNNSFPIAIVSNAAHNMIYHTSFEDEPMIKGTVHSFSDTRSKAGKYSLLISKYPPNESYSWTPFVDVDLTETVKYKYSCWVYSDGPSADLYFFMKPNLDDDFYSTGWKAYYQRATETNKWVYLEGEVDVPASTKRLYLRVDNNATNGGGNVWFDELRLHPVDAQMTTYTYDPLIGITSQTDINGNTTLYEYDGFGQLKLVKDKDEKIIQQNLYHYRGQH